MAQIRQEINILDSVITATISTTSNEKVQLDTTKYNGTVTYYAEFVAKTTNAATSIANAVAVYDGSNALGGVNNNELTTSYTLIRKQFTPTSSTIDYSAICQSNGSITVSVKSARIVIIQNATTLTNTETQIEIGNASSTTATVDTALTNPKYWQYTGANWDGTITAYFEGTFMTGTSKSAATMTLQESSSITAPSWSNVASSAVTTTNTTATRVRSGAITLTAGNWYRAVMKAGNSKSGITVYNAKVIIDQVDGGNLGTADGFQAEIRGGTAGAGQLAQAQAQSFKIQTTSSVTGVKLRFRKVGSPTDTLNIDIVSSLGGSSLANATQSCSALTTSAANYTYTFNSPVSLTGGNTYYIQVTRSPDTFDSTNDVVVFGPGAGYPDGSNFARDNNTWGAAGGNDWYFELIGQAGITKLEPQYLLANTLFAAGTGLQTFLTKWDSTEWDAGSGSITYNFQAEAADNSTSDVTLEKADGSGTIATVTNVDNAGSASATMPTSQNLDTKATTNAGDVAAARILVVYAFSASAAETQYAPGKVPVPQIITWSLVFGLLGEMVKHLFR